MSDPYGSNPYGDPAGQNPYGSPTTPPSEQQSPYGAPQYNPTSAPYGGYGGAPGGNPQKTDGVSIAALVVGVIGLCTAGVGGLVAIVLGILGINRTKAGRAKGRGLAIGGLVLGVIGVLELIAVIALVVFGVHQVVTPSSAKVGQCIDITTHSSRDAVSIIKASCDGEHDGQIVGTGSLPSGVDPATAGQACQQFISDANKTKLMPHQSELELRWAADDPDHLSAGDRIICYVTGDHLTSDLLSTAS